MQEEVENRTVNLAISTTKLTFRTIVNGYNAWKRHHQAKAAQKSAQMPLGKQSIKELIGQNQGDVYKRQVLDTVRTVYSIDIEKDKNDVITIRVCGNGFLYNMVRILAGTLMAVGMGQRTPEEMPKILAACDRAAAGPTAPAKGLMLAGMEYQD